MAKLIVPFRSPRLGETPRPFIHIELRCPATNRAMKAVAILDTGADDCAFPIGFAKILGFDFQNTDVLTATTAGGPANSYPREILLKAFADGNEVHFPKDSVRFMDGLHTPLLGVRTFLKYFTVEFDYFAQEFSLTLNNHAKNSDVQILEVDQISYGSDETG